MRTTHRPDSPTLAPGAERPAEPARDAHKPNSHHPVAPSPALSAAMRLLHRPSAAQNRFMSAEERAYFEHRRHSCD